MLFPLRIDQFLREIALFYTNFFYKFFNLWSKVEGHKTPCSIFIKEMISTESLAILKSAKMANFDFHIFDVAKKADHNKIKNSNDVSSPVTSLFLDHYRESLCFFVGSYNVLVWLSIQLFEILKFRRN